MYHNTVIPGKDCKLIQTCDEVPAGGDISSYEDARGQDGERVHGAGRRSWRRARRAAGGATTALEEAQGLGAQESGGCWARAAVDSEDSERVAGGMLSAMRQRVSVWKLLVAARPAPSPAGGRWSWRAAPLRPKGLLLLRTLCACSQPARPLAPHRPPLHLLSSTRACSLDASAMYSRYASAPPCHGRRPHAARVASPQNRRIPRLSRPAARRVPARRFTYSAACPLFLSSLKDTNPDTSRR